MVQVEFAPSFKKHVPVDSLQVSASRVIDALEQVFDQHPDLRGYVLDDQGAVRYHVSVFVNNETINDRTQLTDALREGDQVFVFQALSGG